MSRRLMVALILLLLLTLLPAYSPAVAATNATAPPLPRGCGRGSAAIDDYATAICCVSGYVYLNGVPVEGAEVTLTLGANSITVQTRRDFGTSQPYYFARLDSLGWLSARPGDEITITAQAYGQSKTQTFIAYEGGQQEDLVLPQLAMNATWTAGEQQLVPAFRQAALADDATRGKVLLFGGLVRQENRDILLAETWQWDGQSWMRLAPRVAPSARSGHVMAYDAGRQRVVLFGGTDADGVMLTDTWEWDGDTWVQRQPATHPAFSARPAMVYARSHGRMLLVGANASAPDQFVTWAWNGTTWSQIPTTVAPPVRTGFALAYDAGRDQVVLSGGIRASVLQNDTWEFNGTTWARTYPLTTPTARTGHAMTYDPERQRVVLVGGVDASGKPQEDSWAWDGSTWTLLPVDLPPRAGALLTYDTTHRHLVLVGGYSDAAATTYPNETWELDAIDWNQRAPRVSPGSRYRSQVAYQPKRQRVVLFSGVGGTNDTWEWDGISWTPRTPPVSAPYTPYRTMVYDEARQYVLLLNGNQSSQTWTWDGHTWTRLFPAISPPPRDSYLMVYDRARERTVLFGGRGSTSVQPYFNDTWVWDGTTWMDVTPDVSPEAHNAYFPYLVMAYDELHERTVLRHSVSRYRTWEWDGVAWTPMTSDSQQTKNYLVNGPMVYDNAHQRVTFFGYDTVSAGWNGMQVWDGTDWSHWSVAMPPTRRYFALTSIPQHQLLMLYGGTNDQFYPSYDDTWIWDGTTWREQPDDSYMPGQLTAAAMDYLDDGYSLLFGGRAPDGTLSNRTFRWQGNRWLLLEPTTTPPPRQAHQIARNRDGSQLLMFGGIGAGGYLEDTWVWNGTDWQQHMPASHPAARAYAGLTYDVRRQVWVLFGGQTSNSYLRDTWEYDGNEWQQSHPATVPPARAGATLTYDPSRGVVVLIGGQNSSGLRNDVWEYDGTTWRDVTPVHSIGVRTGHGAAYDPSRGVIVVTGGLGDAGVLTDTWEWNGAFWRERIATTPLIARYRMAVAYDIYHGEMVAFGGEDATGTMFETTQLHQAAGSLAEPMPIATINRLLPRDARQGSDTILFEGRGADSDNSDIITAYRWSYLNDQGQPVLFSTQRSLTRPAADFPRGAHTIRFEVQDNEGTWSQPVEETIYIRDANGSIGENETTWTLLLYAAADNNLNPWMGSNPDINGMLYRLAHAGAHERIQVGVLYDGPGANDTRRYILNELGVWIEQPQPEARMDEMETLRDFITWGYTTFPTSDYYVLALLDHANGVVGFAEDRSSPAPDGKPFLTPLEIRTALEQATDNGTRKIDVLHYDGCSFGLYETAAIADGLAHYVIASPTTAWAVFAYEEYRAHASNATNPRDYATAVAATYADRVGHQALAYTISVFDMAQFDRLDTSVSAFGDALLTYVDADRANRVGEFRTLRNAAQKYDSGGLRQIEPDVEDAYVDIVDLAERVATQVDDPAVDAAASALIDAVQGNPARGIPPFVIAESHATHNYTAYDPNTRKDTTFAVDLGHAHGIGLFYPPRISTDTSSAYLAYVQHKLFHITRDNGWTRFIAGGLPPQLSGDPAAMPNDGLIAPLVPLADDPDPDPTTEPTTEPTAEPTVEPTAEPTAEPTVEPTATPTAEPDINPARQQQLFLPLLLR